MKKLVTLLGLFLLLGCGDDIDVIVPPCTILPSPTPSVSAPVDPLGFLPDVGALIPTPSPSPDPTAMPTVAPSPTPVPHCHHYFGYWHKPCRKGE